MKKIILIAVTIICMSCSEKATNDLQINLLNSELISNIHNDTINIIHYTVTNNSNKIYYLNNIIMDKTLFQKEPYQIGVYNAGKSLRIFDNSGKEAKYKKIYPKLPSESDYLESVEIKCLSQNIERQRINAKRLGYKEILKYESSREGYTNFFIHPNETIHFEYYINVTDTIKDNNNYRTGYAILEPDKSYKAKLFIASDSTELNNILPRDVLETIKENNAKVYHGILESNDIPIRVLH
jgi:hypothetical protein